MEKEVIVKKLKFFNKHSTIINGSEIRLSYDVQKLARHTDMRTIMKYVYAVDGRLKKMVNRGEFVSIEKIKN